MTAVDRGISSIHAIRKHVEKAHVFDAEPCPDEYLDPLTPPFARAWPSHKMLILLKLK